MSPPSDAVGTDPWVQPVTTTPNPPVITITDPLGETDPVPIRYVTATCPVETYPEYRVRHSINEDALGAWSGWSTVAETTASMWFGEKLMVEVEARCISDWTPEIPGTEGPPATTVNPPWIRPIPAPDAPQNVRHDNGGTSTPKADRVLWDGVVCPTNTTVGYNPNRAGVGYAGWQSALTYNVATSYGTHYSYHVVARCVSPYTVSPNSEKSNETGWTIPIPTPSKPTIEVPYWQYASNANTTYWFSVTGGGSTCAWPSDTYYNFINNFDGASNLDRKVDGRGNANASDYWSSPRWVEYKVQVQCRTADTKSEWSAWSDKDTIEIRPEPAPAAPTGGATSSFMRLCGPPYGFAADIDWDAAARATSYTVSYTFLNDTGDSITKSFNTTSTSASIYEDPSWSSPSFTFKLRSNGAGGSSAYASGTPPQGAGGCSAR